MKTQVEVKKITYCLPIMLVCVYTFTRGGAALMISTAIWTAILAFLLLCSLYNLVKTSTIKCKKEAFLVVLMVGIIIFWNNKDFSNGIWFLDYLMVVFLIFLLSAMRTDYWIETAYRMMIIMSFYHMIWTLVCFVYPPAFYNIVYPIVQPITLYDLTAMYKKGFIMGFNYSNSQNAIYLAMGLMILICSLFFSNKKINHRIMYIITLALLSISLLLTGKRGPVLWLAFAFFTTYYIYNCDKKFSRLVKTIFIIILLLFLFYIGSLFIPEMMNFINRFTEQIEAGDISTHRFELWEKGWNDFLNKPFLGNGWFWFKYNNEFGKNYNVHNCFIQWLCELGIIGSLPFFIFTILNYVRSIKLIKNIKLKKIESSGDQIRNIAFALMYQTYFIIYSFAGTCFYEPETLLPWVFSCAIIIYYWHSMNYGVNDNKILYERNQDENRNNDMVLRG